ncbi:TonB-dependent receptor family protein [Urechidicola vernalis]|uniref:TonB-dependent receptor n=1 Tax=Urechidicola vernalis TaxID=3075600 RepID=A0ABU2Y2V6_9FLAO|nr:TonB-dependent receptor [Urechidicola sp. P050]MDT0552543.1 TonB-dependent receptor [Urechidicola sp. P050]
MRCTFSGLLVLLSFYTTYSQKEVVHQTDSIQNSELLDEIVVKSSHFRSSLKSTPSSISVLKSAVINSSNTINIASVLNTIPGLYMHNGTLTTNRITIRGIGSRNLFGTSKIRAYYKDIPLTNGSGFSTIEDIDMKAIGSVEILKGPSSSLYGSGLGGTIQINPFSNKNNSFGSIEYYNGSFGMQKINAIINYSSSNGSTSIIYSNLHSDGYRENNETDRETISLNSSYNLNENNQLNIFATYIDLKAFIPSSLNEQDYINDPTKAAFTWGRAKGYEDYKKGLFGLSWQHKYSQNTEQYTSIFTSFLDAYEPRPFNILQEKTNGIGIRSRLNSSFQLFSKQFEYVIGGELFSDTNEYQTFENLYREYPPETGSVQGGLLSDLKEKRSYFNLFLDSKYHFSNTLFLSAGLNLNKTYYDLTDYYNNENDNLSGDYKYDLIVSPKAALTYAFAKNNMVFISSSHGFSTPSLEETLLPNGLINTAIKPESGWNFEIGSRGQIIKNHSYDVALFRMNVKDLLVARRTGDNQFIGVNAGKTTYNGLEIATYHQLIKSDNIDLKIHNAFTLNNFKFKDFVTEQNDYSGNDLTGVPNQVFNSSLFLNFKSGAYISANYNYIGSIPMRDDNSKYSESYQIINTKFGFKAALFENVIFDFYGGINNIFDEKYASMLLINASSFGGNAPRYYYPGEPINYYFGMQLNYQF